MPLNTLRLNHQKSSHPNDRIVFIKPLPRPQSDQASYDLADTYLRAIAAQCLPIMKEHYLSVTTLEEYEPNREFIGRNFNNGEIIQLVLRSKNGGWVPFNMVQMVMMHELAHNTHMNHGREFWKTRNQYADELKALWTRGYTGEGFWGSGRTLNDLTAVMGNNVLSSEQLDGLPLCGGTFRSRRRTRKRRRKGAGAGAGEGQELSWKEKRDRRIERKFGKNGVALGEDEDQRLRLEINRRGPVGTKPRVAQSKRGRELRAAAALARFASNKMEVGPVAGQDGGGGSGTGEDEDEDEDYEDVDVDAAQEDATDVNGRKLLDSHGLGMVRVCDDEDVDDVNVQHELRELGALDRYFKPAQHVPDRGDGRVGNTESGDESKGERLRRDTAARLSEPRGRGITTPKPSSKSRGRATSTSDAGNTTLNANPNSPDPATRRTTAANISAQTESSTNKSHFEAVPPPSSRGITQDIDTTTTTTTKDPQARPAQHPDHSSLDLSLAAPTLTPSPTPTPAAAAAATAAAATAAAATAAAGIPITSDPSPQPAEPKTPPIPTSTTIDPTTASTNPNTITTIATATRTTTDGTNTLSCPLCSLENTNFTATCMACSHVLDVQKDPRHWPCQSEICLANRTGYLNPGDAGICGICGTRRRDV